MQTKIFKTILKNSNEIYNVNYTVLLVIGLIAHQKKYVPNSVLTLKISSVLLSPAWTITYKFVINFQFFEHRTQSQ